ncbi:MAG: CHASE2 domain-containing protein, partial [Candidatus Rokubacteria bacterium]|nr:CHASE2 domain-containing protein [Candidatus Rokubacteria bacterium]
NVVLGSAITRVHEQVAGMLVTKDNSTMPLPVVREGAAAAAPVNVSEFVDDDGRLRHAAIRYTMAGQRVLSWDLELYNLAKRAGLPAAPLPRANEIVINFRGGPRTFPWIPYHRVVNGGVDPEEIRGKIVLVGATSVVLQDVFSTPFARNRTMPGVEVHANVLETLLRGIPITPVPPWASVAVAAACAVLSAWLVARFRALRALVGVAVLWLALGAWTFTFFVAWDVWVRAVGAMIALGLGYGAAVTENFIREQRQRRQLSQFFSPSVLNEIVRHPADATLGSSRRTLTVMFSDLRGFTSLSEQVQPEQVAEMLREYLTAMTEIVFRHRGTVDKYMGDCVMALYNAPLEDPDHAVNAIRTGLEFQERTREVSARWQERLGIQLKNGVGINTGEAVVGTMGAAQRLEYTAIGDTVNLASRLEGLTKDYGASIIISESTYHIVKEQFLTRHLGAVPVKGKAQPVPIYGVYAETARKHARAPLATEVSVTAPDGAVHAARLYDVAVDGFALKALPEGALAAGDVVQIRSDGGPLGTPITATARVAWRRDDGAGLAVTSIDDDARAAIAVWVDRERPA